MPWFNRSQTRTSESSAPEAKVPRRDGDHSIQLTFAAWPRSSSRAWPGCLTSRIRIIFESWEKVARRCVSCGDAANLNNGGAYDIVCCARVGLILPPGLASTQD